MDRNKAVSQHMKAIIDFYKEPLCNAVIALRKSGYTLNDIKREVFNNEVSAQAIDQNYFKNDEKRRERKKSIDR